MQDIRLGLRLTFDEKLIAVTGEEFGADCGNGRDCLDSGADSGEQQRHQGEEQSHFGRGQRSGFE
jgi:hypothetical protein